MTLIGSLMAIEDIELLSQLYKGLDYEQRSAVYSDSKLELLKIIISQQSSNMEQLKAKSGSFEDIIINAKCNFPDYKLELVSLQPQNNDTDKKEPLKYFNFVTADWQFYCKILYFCSWRIIFDNSSTLLLYNLVFSHTCCICLSA